jgi:2-polyprenyl-3-methyl-5-hydroxy-6-metoxy-1,4-benzoquinol methylase
MKTELLELLRCPKTGQVVDAGWLVSEDGHNRYPIHNNIPRFVPQTNYADNFGMQWNHFRQTQLDSYSGHSISANRSWKATGWSPDVHKGKWVLNIECGAGRFAEVALNSGAKVVAFDYTSAVDACYANLKHHPNLHVVQGDIYALPLSRNTFSFVYSLGVLQHTPDVAVAFAAMPPMVKNGGRLCVDFYEKSWKSLFRLKCWLRPLTKRMSKASLFSLLQRVVLGPLPLGRVLGSVPLVGSALKRMVPVVNYYGTLPLNGQQYEEWSLLDTFDWLSPNMIIRKRPQPQSGGWRKQA